MAMYLGMYFNFRSWYQINVPPWWLNSVVNSVLKVDRALGGVFAMATGKFFRSFEWSTVPVAIRNKRNNVG
ncbi:MAG: hypothetical protein COB66_07790 [Coxiella sp. (in: Bacteria)]|nr:MAG: hypothetical protein COB66_07790 [Coxiella sp. (in: g-proteobacteria)]